MARPFEVDLIGRIRHALPGLGTDQGHQFAHPFGLLTGATRVWPEW